MKKNRAQNSKKPANYKPKTAINTTMDYLARRNHSEKELRQKLSKKYSVSEIDEALEFCRENNWLTPPESLAEQTTNVLHRRKKGFLFIQRYLKQKGLPVPLKNCEIEEEKVRELLERKFKSLPDFKSRQKAHRFLKSRGFEDEVIRKVLYANDRT